MVIGLHLDDVIYSKSIPQGLTPKQHAGVTFTPSQYLTKGTIFQHKFLNGTSTANSILRPVTVLGRTDCFNQSLLQIPFPLAEGRVTFSNCKWAPVTSSFQTQQLLTITGKGPFLQQVQGAQHLGIMMSFLECYEIIDILN